MASQQTTPDSSKEGIPPPKYLVGEYVNMVINGASQKWHSRVIVKILKRYRIRGRWCYCVYKRAPGPFASSASEDRLEPGPTRKLLEKFDACVEV